MCELHLAALTVGAAALFTLFQLLQPALYCHHLFGGRPSKAAAVGVSHHVIPESGIHFRVYYPAAAATGGGGSVRVFVAGHAATLAGYLHVFGGQIFGRRLRHAGSFLFTVVAAVLGLAGVFLDFLGVLSLPFASDSATPLHHL